MITRGTYADIQAYATRVQANDIDDAEEMPTAPLLRGMSRILDIVCEEHYQNIEAPLHESIEMGRAVLTLTHGPRTCGGFKPEKGILGNLTPFEQMSALGLSTRKKAQEFKCLRRSTLKSPTTNFQT